MLDNGYQAYRALARYLREGDYDMVRDYWIYQRRDVRTPWAFYVVKEFDRRKPEATLISFTLYHEDIENPTHSVTKDSMYFHDIRGYVDEMTMTLTDMGITVTSDDRQQLTREVNWIMESQA